MEDIAPKLLEEIQSDFEREVKNSAKVKRITDKIKKGTATYEDVDEYAVEIGEILSNVYGRHISSEVLPDGKMYYNIAERVVYGTLEWMYERISNAAEQVQDTLNRKAGIGIKAIKTPMNSNRVMGIVNKVVAAKTFDDVSFMLGEPVINFAQSIVTENIKSNVDFHGQAGLSPTITRIVRGNCCEWCSNLAGRYKYPKVPKEVYQRHRYCRCLVIYDSADGKRENVHTKRELTPEEEVALKARKRFRDFKYQNVTAEYFGTARPGEGKITYGDNLKESTHRKEIEVAGLIHKTFGGNITIPKERNAEYVKNPDYVWKDKLWDLKTLTTEKSADTAIRKGLRQIAENPGGIIIDYRGKNISIDRFEEVMDRRMARSAKGTTDILVILKNNEFRVYRYKK